MSSELSDDEWLTLVETLDCEARKRSRTEYGGFVRAALERIAPIFETSGIEELKREGVRAIEAAYRRELRRRKNQAAFVAEKELNYITTDAFGRTWQLFWKPGTRPGRRIPTFELVVLKSE